MTAGAPPPSPLPRAGEVGAPSAPGEGETRTTVLITRPLPAAEATAARVLALGRPALVAPLLAIRVLAADLPEAPAAIAVTSGHALAGLPARLHGVPLFAVGAATAARARAAGFAVVASADGDAAALAALLRRDAPAGELLLAVGEGQGAALEQALTVAGRKVLRRAVYAAEPAADLPAPARAALAAGTIGAALFFSAETARVFVRLARAAGVAENLGSIEACAIGRPAGVALEALRWRRIRLAANPTEDAMLALLR